ncbi:MAG: pilus assembly protein N-terminal domain-containing protein [Myxococcaceae bacterium]|jgi:Flp pilus assembly secretin CpaC|nr:pilus assembly protein N-terminal domain-containing protein [Myxococcaceae bacterium]
MRTLLLVFAATVVHAAPPGAEVVTDASSMSTTELLERARTEAKESRFDKAIWFLTVCVQREPKNHDCVVSLASNYGRRGAYNRSRSDELEAARWYKRFLEIAPHGDRRVARVEELLGSLPPDPREAAGPVRVSLETPRVLRVHQLTRVSSSNPEVVTAVLQADDEIRLEGKRVGKARVTGWNKEGTATHWDIAVGK